ncbi:MAG: toll/interleukin-1 receptor domain-containing protein [Flavobacterium sp.]|nr:toll/interleukin-1 receptor domain-containing protein [Flavobacterium sp.]
MVDLKDFTIIVWDEIEEFSRETTQRHLGLENGESTLYRDVKRFHSQKELDEIYDQISEDDAIVLCCHVSFGGNFKGYYTLRNFKNNSKYKFPEIIYISSNNDANKAFNNEMADKVNIFAYSELITKLRLGEICGFNKKDMLQSKSISQGKKGVFLSHSSKDKEIVFKFKETILQLGLEIQIHDIKFTSSEVGGIAAGENISDNLRQFIKNDMGLFIQFVSQDYIESRTCLNEEGAAWCIIENLMYVTISLENFTRSFIKGPNKSINIDNKESLLNIYENRKSFFGEKNIVLYNQKVEEFLMWLKNKAEIPNR